MLSTQTLVGLACLIANNPGSDASAIENRLTASERATVGILLEQKDACLPGNIELLLRETQEKINSGVMIDPASQSMPTNGCF